MCALSQNKSLKEKDYSKIMDEHALFQEEITSLTKKVSNLEGCIDRLKEQLYNPKSEKRGKGFDFLEDMAFQHSLLPSSLEDRPLPEAEVKTRSKKKVNKSKSKKFIDEDGDETRFSPKLPRKKIILEPESNETCCNCSTKQEIDQRITEKLQTIPATHYVEKTIRPVYKCKCNDCPPFCAPAADSSLPKSSLGDSFLASMLVNKFAWHLPFYRQSKMLEESGIELSRNAMIRAGNQLGTLLNHVVKEMHKEILTSKVVSLDETPVSVGKNKDGSVKFDPNSYFWVIATTQQIVFKHFGGRNYSYAEELLSAYDSSVEMIVSDAYGAYLSYVKQNPEISLILCWDHSRRKFHEIAKQEPLAEEALSQIGQLYLIEREIKKRELKEDEILKYRTEHSKPVLDKFKKWCEVVRDAEESLPKDKLVSACNYVLGNWEGFSNYVDNGAAPISNIIAEQQIRNIKLGEKNWLFAASEVGADTVAVMNSLVCTCRMNKINILEYFNDIVSRLSTDPAYKLTPLAWKKEQAGKVSSEQN